MDAGWPAAFDSDSVWRPRLRLTGSDGSDSDWPGPRWQGLSRPYRTLPPGRGTQAARPAPVTVTSHDQSVAAHPWPPPGHRVTGGRTPSESLAGWQPGRGPAAAARPADSGPLTQSLSRPRQSRRTGNPVRPRPADSGTARPGAAAAARPGSAPGRRPIRPAAGASLRHPTATQAAAAADSDAVTVMPVAAVAAQRARCSGLVTAAQARPPARLRPRRVTGRLSAAVEDSDHDSGPQAVQLPVLSLRLGGQSLGVPRAGSGSGWLGRRRLNMHSPVGS